MDISNINVELTVEEAAELEMLKNGGERVRGEFFERYRIQLRNIARFRLDPRLKRRISDSDIMQEASVKYVKEIEPYLENPSLPPKVWLRRLVQLVIWRINRHHFNAKSRDVRRECDLDTMSGVCVNWMSKSLPSVGNAIDRDQLRKEMRYLVSQMPKLEREIVTLVHFEDQTVREAAMELGIGYEAAKKRYRRSLERLRRAHQDINQRYLG